jgi:hypothetical protein
MWQSDSVTSSSVLASITLPPPPRFTFLYISYTQRYFRIAKMPDISRCNNCPNIRYISERHLFKSRPSRTPVEHRQLQPPQKRLANCCQGAVEHVSNHVPPKMVEPAVKKGVVVMQRLLRGCRFQLYSYGCTK